MKISLTAEQKRDLELLHRHEDDARVCDRIKAVLLNSEGWTQRQIAQALRIHEETVRQHLKDWDQDEKLKTENGGSWSRLTEHQTEKIIQHLEEKLYTKVIDICAYVQATYRMSYTVSGMTKWLHQKGFSYKQPKGVPLKADVKKQEEFIEYYLRLVEETPAEEPIVFIDSMHPTMATKISCGWIKKGMDKPIEQSASRTRVNVMGAIELSTMKVTSWRPELVNGESTIEFLKQLQAAYSLAPRIHVILDNSGYHRSERVKAFAKTNHIELHYLPAYSPNLNPIERLWKVMNERVRNNRFFKTAKEFRETIALFFDVTLPKISGTLRGRINDNFQIINPASSS
jgi:transposase